MKSTLHYLFVLLLAGAPQNAPGKGTIQGIVVKAGSGQPLRGARISFRRVDGNPGAFGNSKTPVTTDATGRFLVTGVDPGQYRVSAERDGYVRQEFGQRTPAGGGSVISVSAGQRLELQFQMLPAAVISGRVADEQGEPVAQLTVQAWTYKYAEGKRSLDQVAKGQTNDIGEYRLFWLPPGEYFVSVTMENGAGAGETATADLSAPQTNSTSTIAANIAATIGAAGGLPNGLDGGALEKFVQAMGDGREPAQIYFPGTSNPDSAAPIKLGAAVEMRAIDFNLRPVRTVNVRGRVVSPLPAAQAGAAGRNSAPVVVPGLGIFAQGTQVSLSRAGAKAALASLGVGGTAANADGTFEIRGVAPGSYILTAIARQPNAPVYTARMRVEVGDADLGNIVMALRPGVSIPGRVVVDSAPQNFRMNQLRVTFVTSDSVGGFSGLVPGLDAINSTVSEDGTFTLLNVGAQEYRVRVTGMPAGMYLVAGRLGSVDVLNGAFVPPEDDRNGLQLQLGAAPGRVAGVVVDAKGNPYPGALAALVPDESRRGRLDLYSAIPTDQSGRFSFNNVAPGNYRIFAWEEIPTGAYQDPDYIRRFEARAKPVVVQQNGSTETEVSVIPPN